MKKWITGILTGLSMLLLVAGVGSYAYTVFTAYSDSKGNRYIIELFNGSIGLMHMDNYYAHSNGFSFRARPLWSDNLKLDHDELMSLLQRLWTFDYEYRTSNTSSSISVRALRFPFWFPMLITALWPLYFWTRYIRRRYFNPGCCRKCGYDLRGSTSDSCPECGKPKPQIVKNN